MAQTEQAIEDVTADLASTNFEEKEVSFAGKKLKLDSEDDANDIVLAVKSCVGMTSLCLEGNTVGCDAAKAIAKALESQPKLKRALWKDMFTGRLKTEIPKALNYLSSGVILAGAKLVELDLSDNAFGPVGVEGIASLISSPSCYTLQELRLNNNGLGPHGGKLLARALQDCLEGSKSSPTPFAFRVLVCGRNRLENEGAQALAAVFKALGSLEEVSMPQNGIYHEGISAVASALSHNPNLKVLNLNDNTFTEEGARAFSVALGSLQKLEIINFGDCLVRSLGASFLCDALRNGHQMLRELHLNNNEIGKEEGIAIAEAMENKLHLERLELNGNSFGQEGRELIEGTLEAIGQSFKLGSLSDDEGEDEDEDDDDYRAESDDGQEPVESAPAYTSPLKKQVTASDFYACPTANGLKQLGDERSQLLLAALGDTPTTEQYIEAFMKISRVAEDDEVHNLARECADKILAEAFAEAKKNDTLSTLTNTLLVHLGLIKCEDKKFRASSSLSGVLAVLEHAVKESYFHPSTLDVLQLFLSRPNSHIPPKDLHPLMTALYQR